MRNITQDICVLQARIEGIRDDVQMIKEMVPEYHKLRYGLELVEEKISVIEKKAAEIGKQVNELEEWTEEVSR